MAMAETPQKSKRSSHFSPKPLSPSSLLISPTPETAAPPPCRSSQRLSLISTPQTHLKLSSAADVEKITNDALKTPNSAPKSKGSNLRVDEASPGASFSLVSPDCSEEPKRRKVSDNELKTVVTRSRASRTTVQFETKKKKVNDVPQKRRMYYYKKVSYDGGEFSIGDGVYVKRREDASSDDEDPEVEECRICYKSGKSLMIECDDCLGGFHLKCLKPPLKKVPEEDWICGFCEARKLGKKVELPSPPKGKKRRRTLREKLLLSDLWAT